NGQAHLNHILWDRNTTANNGVFDEIGRLDGAAGFDLDGYHITSFSMALGAGADAGVTVDIDGEPRPAPQNTQPDLGADEYPFQPGVDLSAQKVVFEPKGVVTVDQNTGQTTFSVVQDYLIRFFHGNSVTEPLHVAISDSLASKIGKIGISSIIACRNNLLRNS
ncbi:MAG: hypothetical protein PHQ40_16780, partial [Anaerolineaceae bacterium]|nr:hypothetical protein [Anaerolineaceae bacterium]